ncbi:MAG: hypothetical protein M1833_006238 [Piccolia ochrophora]|nr:MAG: hypothetical protein M1833_006238 [Piccolia ochrophora]
MTVPAATNPASSSSTTSPPSLTFPRATFAKLSPSPYLHAHLSPSNPSHPALRPNGRHPDAFRPPTAHTGSLTHADGSAVVRTGDTAVVCGVRAEVLLAAEVSGYDAGQAGTGDEISELGLLVPNLELATGCSPAHLPGQPPSVLAQSLSERLSSLLSASKLVDPEDLRISYHPASLQEDEEMQGQGEGGDESKPEIKAFWTLYVDVLFISLDGNPFDAAWAAVLAALADTRLPRAWWDADREMVLCDDNVDRATKLRLRGAPIASTLSVFADTAGTGQQSGDAKGKAWVLADPDAFEEGLCNESVTIAVDCSSNEAREKPRIIKLEKAGGGVIGMEEMERVVELAIGRWKEWQDVLHLQM